MCYNNAKVLHCWNVRGNDGCPPFCKLQEQLGCEWGDSCVCINQSVSISAGLAYALMRGVSMCVSI